MTNNNILEGKGASIDQTPFFYLTFTKIIIKLTNKHGEEDDKNEILEERNRRL